LNLRLAQKTFRWEHVVIIGTKVSLAVLHISVVVIHLEKLVKRDGELLMLERDVA